MCRLVRSFVTDSLTQRLVYFFLVVLALHQFVFNFNHYLIRLTSIWSLKLVWSLINKTQWNKQVHRSLSIPALKLLTKRQTPITSEFDFHHERSSLIYPRLAFPRFPLKYESCTISLLSLNIHYTALKSVCFSYFLQLLSILYVWWMLTMKFLYMFALS